MIQTTRIARDAASNTQVAARIVSQSKLRLEYQCRGPKQRMVGEAGWLFKAARLAGFIVGRSVIA